MTFSLTLALALSLSVLFRAECVLAQGKVEVVVTTPANLQQFIRKEINSALYGITMDRNATLPEMSWCNENFTETVINSLNAITDRLDNLQQRLETLHHSTSANPASSCAEILRDYPTSVSGYYWVSNATGHPHSVYCDMTRSCGGATGGWMRVAYLDMTNSTHRCPSSLHPRVDSGIRSCAVKTSSGSCSSVYYTSHGINYSRVCGRIRGYFVQSPDGYHHRSHTTINSNYVDGVSLTYGTRRQHIWTFASSHDAYSFHPPACPCGSVPAFVGNHYFCDGHPVFTTNLANPLWDGEECGSRACCNFNNPPWFYRQLSHTTADIEMRLCRNEPRDNEDVTVHQVEIYVQ